MKKILTLIACLSGVASMVSCQKELTGNESVCGGHTITLHINDDATCKSAFDGIDKISLTGEEHLCIYYVASTGIAAGSVEATPSGSGTYTFTVPGEITPADYSWYAVSPYSPAMHKINTTVTYQTGLTISPVQLPGANTFDANYDFLLSDKFTIGEGTATINRFKRVAAPLLLNITGLDASDKIFAVTLTLSTPASGTGLSGRLNVKFSDTFAEAGAVSMTYPGNGVSAIYANGLSAVSGSWPVWFMVSPSALSEGTQMTVKVTTSDKTYERTVAFPSTKELVTNSISRINFNAKGEGFSEKQTIFQAFYEKSVVDSISKKATVNLVASDGNEYTWTFSRAGCAMQDKDVASGMPYGVQLSASKALKSTNTAKHLIVPSFGKTVLTSSIFMHPSNYSSATVSYYSSPISDSTTFYTKLPFSNAVLADKGGVSTVSLPAEMQTLAGSYIIPTVTLNIVAGLFEVSNISYDSNDYYDMFDKGGDIKIGDRTVNKTNYPKYKLVTADDITLNDINDYENGVVFIDNSKSVNLSNESHISFKSGTVLIGRYKNRTQPVLKITGTGSVYFRPVSNYFKNIRFESAGSGHFVPAAVSSGGSCSFVCDDCTLICAKNLLRESSGDRNFGDVVFNNCVIENAGSGLFGYATAGKPMIATDGSFTFTNCVISTKSTDGTSMTSIEDPMFNLSKTSISTDSPTKIVFKNNTIIGFTSVNVICAKTIGGFDLENNIIVGNWKSGSYSRLFKTTADQGVKPSPCIISNNFSPKYEGTALDDTTGDSKKRWNADDHSKELSITSTGNLWTSTKSPFTSADYANLYFPVDKSVVTNGAGASYSTKLWKDWTGGSTKASHEGFHPVD